MLYGYLVFYLFFKRIVSQIYPIGEYLISNFFILPIFLKLIQVFFLLSLIIFFNPLCKININEPLT